MDDERIDMAAQLLKSARIENKVIECIPQECRPRNLDEAYAVRDRFIELLGWSLGGWFCACTNQQIQKILKLDEPYYAYLLADFIRPSPAVLQSTDFPPLVLECEFGFRLERDLPVRQDPYTRSEVEAAIAAVHPTIEVVAGHLKNWPEQDVFSVIADNGTDGALIYGEGVSEWRQLNLIDMAVVLAVNGSVQRSGKGQNVLGDPLDAFVWLVNALSRDGHGARAGQIHNTGTATEIIWVEPGDEVAVEFKGLGRVDLEIA